MWLEQALYENSYMNCIWTKSIDIENEMKKYLI